MLVKGNITPNFSLEGDDSHIHSLKDFRAQNVVLFTLI